MLVFAVRSIFHLNSVTVKMIFLRVYFVRRLIQLFIVALCLIYIITGIKVEW